MKKCFLLTTISVIVVNCILFSSCKKTIHYPHASPGGIRLASYSLVGTSTYSLSPSLDCSTNENYAFSYDALNRVSSILFSTNNPLQSNEDISFSYSNDTIYKTITTATPSLVIEKDTFLVNSQGQIAIAFTPNTTTSFQYYNNLLTIMITTNETTQLAVTNTYTSDVGNFLENTSSAGAAADQNFAYYSNYTNRIGDYLQIASFTMYGYNIYQYVNLVNTIKEISQTTTITYNIDAYSNIASSTANTVSFTGNDTTTVYNFQYENY